MTSIFEHTDYRQYLGEFLAEQKRRDAKWTHRMVCASLGLRTSNFIMLVIQGKRNITLELAGRVSKLFEHSDLEREYFENLVMFAQARSSLEKDFYWKSMLLVKTRNQTKPIEASQYEYYSHWYNPVILELAAMPGRTWDARSLAKALRPRVSAVQVRHSLELLERLGMLRREGELWFKATPSVATPPEVRSVAVFNYQRELIDLARSSLENDPGTIRNFTTVTLEINPKEYDVLVEMLTQFRKQALGVCSSTGPADRVYQLNLQLFPVSHAINDIPAQSDENETEDAP